MICPHSTSSGLAIESRAFIKRDSPRSCRGTLAMGFPKGRSAAFPLAKGGVHTRPANYIDFPHACFTPKGRLKSPSTLFV